MSFHVRYEELMDYVARPSKSVPREPIPPLQIGVPKRVRSVVQEKMNETGISGEKFVVFHGLESDSAASMTSRGDTDSLLPLQFWGQLTKKLQDATGYFCFLLLTKSPIIIIVSIWVVWM